MFFYYYIDKVIMILILIYLALRNKKKNPKWDFLLCLGLFPFILLLLIAIQSFFSGIGLEGDTGGFLSALFVIVIFIENYFYIFLPALILIIVSIYKKHKIKEDE